MALFVLRDLVDDMEGMRPSRLLDQHFGLGLSAGDLLRSALVSPLQRQYTRRWRVDNKDSGSTVHCDQQRFQVHLDVQQFSPDEIQVKVVDNSVLVEGKHEEKQDQHGYVSRHFVRRYVVPSDYQLDAVASSLSEDGVLTISAPRLQALEAKERTIPITHTGPHKTVNLQRTNLEPTKDDSNFVART